MHTVYFIKYNLNMLHLKVNLLFSVVFLLTSSSHVLSQQASEKITIEPSVELLIQHDHSIGLNCLGVAPNSSTTTTTIRFTIQGVEVYNSKTGVKGTNIFNNNIF